jgi:hypothetical protein
MSIWTFQLNTLCTYFKRRGGGVEAVQLWQIDANLFSHHYNQRCLQKKKKIITKERVHDATNLEEQII